MTSFEASSFFAAGDFDLFDSAEADVAGFSGFVLLEAAAEAALGFGWSGFLTAGAAEVAAEVGSLGLAFFFFLALSVAVETFFAGTEAASTSGASTAAFLATFPSLASPA